MIYLYDFILAHRQAAAEAFGLVLCLGALYGARRPAPRD